MYFWGSFEQISCRTDSEGIIGLISLCLSLCFRMYILHIHRNVWQLLLPYRPRYFWAWGTFEKTNRRFICIYIYRAQSSPQGLVWIIPIFFPCGDTEPQRNFTVLDKLAAQAVEVVQGWLQILRDERILDFCLSWIWMMEFIAALIETHMYIYIQETMRWLVWEGGG